MVAEVRMPSYRRVCVQDRGLTLLQPVTAGTRFREFCWSRPEVKAIAWFSPNGLPRSV